MNGGLVICDACGGRLGPISDLTTLRPNGAEFLLIRRGDFCVRSRRGGRPDNHQKRPYAVPSFPSGFMNNFALQTNLAYRRKEMARGFSLTIRADDGSTLLEISVEYMHQAFQRLIDWSIADVGQDVSAVITGPNGFYANHRIKASQDFTWIEEKANSEAFVQLGS